MILDRMYPSGAWEGYFLLCRGILRPIHRNPRRLGSIPDVTFLPDPPNYAPANCPRTLSCTVVAHHERKSDIICCAGTRSMDRDVVRTLKSRQISAQWAPQAQRTDWIHLAQGPVFTDLEIVVQTRWRVSWSIESSVEKRCTVLSRPSLTGAVNNYPHACRIAYG